MWFLETLAFIYIIPTLSHPHISLPACLESHISFSASPKQKEKTLHMGSCLSSETESVTSSTAKVISSAGLLREYSVPVTASQVLQTETEIPASFFLCNSDKLYFDSYIPPLKSHEQLQVDRSDIFPASHHQTETPINCVWDGSAGGEGEHRTLRGLHEKVQTAEKDSGVASF